MIHSKPDRNQSKLTVCTAVACSKVHFECTWYWVTHAYLPDFFSSTKPTLAVLISPFEKLYYTGENIQIFYWILLNYSHNFFHVMYVFQSISGSCFYEQKFLQKNILWTEICSESEHNSVYIQRPSVFSARTDYWHFPSSMLG